MNKNIPLLYWTVLVSIIPLSLASASELDKQNTNIYLMGDSILDNFYWLKEPQKDLCQQLKDMGYNNTYNYAVDESQFDDIIAGKEPRDCYVDARATHNMHKYPINQEGKVMPLELLEETVKKAPNQKHFVVISVGGNNLILPSPRSTEAMIKRAKNLDYKRLFKAIKNISPDIKIVFVFPYLPYIPYFFSKDKPSSYGRDSSLGDFVEKIYPILFQNILNACKEHNLSIINLSGTFNPYKQDDWGIFPDNKDTTSIEPSNASSQYIANLIDHTIHNQAEEPAVYYQNKGKGPIQQKPLSQLNTEDYKSDLKKYIANCEKGKTDNNEIDLVNYVPYILLSVCGLGALLGIWRFAKAKKAKGKPTNRSSFKNKKPTL